MNVIDLATLNRLQHPDRAIRDVVDKLVYSSYRYNRQYSPEITPERWVRVFGAQAIEFEARYQAELDAIRKGAA